VQDILHSIKAAGEALDVIIHAINNAKLPSLLAGKVATRVFKRY
jgi:hypothetical protein